MMINSSSSKIRTSDSKVTTLYGQSKDLNHPLAREFTSNCQVLAFRQKTSLDQSPLSQRFRVVLKLRKFLAALACRIRASSSTHRKCSFRPGKIIPVIAVDAGKPLYNKNIRLLSTATLANSLFLTRQLRSRVSRTLSKLLMRGRISVTGLTASKLGNMIQITLFSNRLAEISFRFKETPLK